jgi:hypothetical protein
MIRIQLEIIFDVLENGEPEFAGHATHDICTAVMEISYKIKYVAELDT